MANNAHSRIQRALISVSDKSGLLDFAKHLSEFGIELISTGGTFQILKEAGIQVQEVSQYTGFPEIMGGRVKTLHPKIHGGILGRRGADGNDEEVMAQHGIVPIDLVVVNLYPFERTIKREDCDLKLAIENIDIGGPTMLRAAAKNYLSVGVVVDTADYSEVLTEIKQNAGLLSYETRFRLAAKAFTHTARYDRAIADYFAPKAYQSDLPSAHVDPWPRHHQLQLVKSSTLRYGENPHQRAAFYLEPDAPRDSLATAEQLQGKLLSFNNIADSDAAFECVKSFEQTACVIVKHANPCGVGVGNTALEAYEKAFKTDPTSAFGGIIAFNRPLDVNTAKAILKRQFVEVVIAPGIDDDALNALSKKPNVRVLTTGDIAPVETTHFDYKRVNGGLLVQDGDHAFPSHEDLKVVSERPPTSDEWRDLLFAWRVVKFVKSNAIVYAKDLMTLGIGAGQMSRVYSSKVAVMKATDEGLDLTGSVMASDAFFPFADGLDVAREAGITAVISPGGSVRDKEVVAAADEANMACVFTGIRHFRH